MNLIQLVNMEKYVLSVPQMIELINLGLDTSGAELYWYQDVSWELPRVIEKDILGEELKMKPEKCTPTFTIQDIVDILPQHIEEKEIGRFDYELRVKKDEVTYESFDVYNQLGEPFTLISHSIYDDECETILDCAFEALKWCLENKYI